MRAAITPFDIDYSGDAGRGDLVITIDDIYWVDDVYQSESAAILSALADDANVDVVYGGSSLTITINTDLGDGDAMVYFGTSSAVAQFVSDSVQTVGKLKQDDGNIETATVRDLVVADLERTGHQQQCLDCL